MDLFQNLNWDLLDYNGIGDSVSADFYWTNQSACMDMDVCPADVISQSQEMGCKRKKEQNEACSRAGAKACREKMRREKMNDRFLELGLILEPGKPAKTDKSAILSDSVRALNQLRSETQDLKERNTKLREDIKNLKAEKVELRGEKNSLKAEKEKMEQQVKSMPVLPGGFTAIHQVNPYHSTGKKTIGTVQYGGIPQYGGMPMWQWISPAVLDTSQDHFLRPPVA